MRLLLTQTQGVSLALPLDDRVVERINPELAGRPQLIQGNSQVLFPGMSSLNENCMLNVKNKSHSITAGQPLPAGQHQVRMEFAYDGGGLGKGGTATLSAPTATTTSSTPPTSSTPRAHPKADHRPGVGLSSVARPHRGGLDRQG